MIFEISQINNLFFRFVFNIKENIKMTKCFILYLYFISQIDILSLTFLKIIIIKIQTIIYKTYKWIYMKINDKRPNVKVTNNH